MNEKNASISADLIGLRSGLSIISKYADEIRRLEESTENEKDRTFDKLDSIYHKKKKCDDLVKQISLQKDKCKEIENKIANVEYMSNYDLLEINVGFNPPKEPGFFLEPEYRTVGWIGAGIIGLFIILFCIYISGGDREWFKIALGICFFTVPLFNFLLIRPIAAGIKKIKWKKDCKEYRKEFNERYTTSLNETLEKEISFYEQLQRDYKNAEQAIEAAQTSHENQKKIEARKKEENSAVIRELARKSNEVNSVLRKTYGFVLMECDWCNIDLIIHYLETGRAESLKEALQQVDRQRQTNDIVNAIERASRAISQHIESAFERMGEALAMSFNKLNNDLSNSLNDISSRMESGEKIINEANRKLINRLDKQISTTELQNALLEKANKSSDELLNDLRYNQQFWRR